MKKLVAFVLALVMATALLSGCSKKEEEKVEEKNELDIIKEKGVISCAVSPDFAPYEFENLEAKNDDEKIVGCEIQLIKYVAEYIGVDLDLEIMDFASCQAAVSNGTVDFSMSGYGITEERKETYNLSDPYTWTDEDGRGQLVIVKKGDAEKFSSPDDFKGKTIAAQNGSLQMNLVNEQLPDVEIEPISSLNDGILSLMNGKVDALACAGDTADNYVENYPNDIEIAVWHFEYSSQGNAALIMKGHDALTDIINEAVKDAADKGLLSQWREEALELAEQLGIENN